jgi:predicted RND superfamily exporter protein
MEKLFAKILKYRWFIIGLVILFTALLASRIPSIRINSDVISSLPDDDPDAVLLKKIGAEFGGNRMGMIIVEAEDIFTPDVLEHVKQITDSVRMIEGIATVTSLTNIIDIKTTEYGMEIGTLVDQYDLPDSPEALAHLKERALSKDMYRGSIISEDGTATIILFSLYDDADIQVSASRVKEKIGSLHLPEQIHYAGSPMLITTIARLISADLVRLLPVAFLLIALILFLGFRSLRGVVLPLLTATFAIIWVIGIMSLSGGEMSMVSNNIPIVLLAVGTAYAIHVLNRIDQVKDNLQRAIITALTYVTIPIILAALTTMTGFMSFIFGSYLSMIRDFGLYTALGTLISLLLSLFFVPAVIAALSWKNKGEPVNNRIKGRSYLSDYFLIPVQKVLFRRPKTVFTIWILVTLLNIGGIFLIKRNVDISDYFRRKNPTRVAEDIMTRKFDGTKPVFVLFKGDIYNPQFLNTMLRTEEYMKQNPGVVATQSVANLIVDLNDAMGEGRKIPDDKDKIEQLWFLLEGSESMQKFVAEDSGEAVIISKFLTPDNQSKKVFRESMNRFISENSTEEYTISITGMPFIDVTMDKSLVYSQLGSLAIAVVVVIIIVGSTLRSLVGGLFATIPIVSAIMVLFGIMGYTGIPLNIVTVLVASIAMGIGIDYAIHVITHFNDSVRNGATIEQALEDTVGISGKAIIMNVISVSAGFMVLLFSQMVPLQYFGLLVMLSMVGSGLSALTFLPAILILAHKGRHSPTNKVTN